MSRNYLTIPPFTALTLPHGIFFCDVPFAVVLARLGCQMPYLYSADALCSH